MESFQVYKDMKARTNGEIYIGVVGPVRTGKSTFIKRFMQKNERKMNCRSLLPVRQL